MNLATEVVNECLTLIYASTSTGLILKSMRERKNELSSYSRLIEIKVEANFGGDNQILDILVNERDRLLYFSTFERIYQVNLTILDRQICNQKTDFYYLYSTKLLEFCQFRLKTCSQKNEKLVRTVLNDHLTNNESYTMAYVELNGTRLLDCHLPHFKYPHLRSESIRWFKDGMRLDSFNSTRLTVNGELIVFNVNVAHEGVYECKIESLDYVFRIKLAVVSGDERRVDEALSELKTKVKDVTATLASFKNQFENQCSPDDF